MSDQIQRVRYYERQCLTVDDFKTEQNYHMEKIAQLVARFPKGGIVIGLEVECYYKDQSKPNDVDAFWIKAGLAVDKNRKAIFVGDEGIKVPFDEFESHKNKPYLSLKYEEEELLVPQSACDKTLQKNRIQESVIWGWEKEPNTESWITVAKIRYKESGEEKKPEVKICGDKYVIEDRKQDKKGKEIIRLDARLIQKEQIAKDAVTAYNIEDGAVTQAKLDPLIQFIGIAGGDLTGNYPNPSIAERAVKRKHIEDGEVTLAKLADEVKTAGGDLTGTYPDPSIEVNAIKKQHILDGEVTLAKLADEVKTVKGDLEGSSYPNLFIKSDAITEGKIATDAVVEAKIKEGSVTEKKIANDAVISSKLNLITHIIDPNTVIPGNGSQIEKITAVDRDEIIHVFPKSGTISWTSKIEVNQSDNNLLDYEITINNLGTTAGATYMIKTFKLG